MLQTVTHRGGEHAREIFENFRNCWFALNFAGTARIEFGREFPEEPGLPLYEYRCTSCGYSFEKIQNFSAEPERECPKCHGVLIRPVTAPALRFEGAGWYVNDYAGKGSAKKADGTGDASAASASDGSSAKETKTESKAGSNDGGTTATAATPVAAPAASSTTPSSSSSS
jgi:putative FmdB family regulatory protein